MWLHRSVVVWIYALSLIPPLVNLNFFPFVLLLLHLYLLHSLTDPYQLHQCQLSILRCRLLTGCILPPPVQKVLFLIFLVVIFPVVVSFIYFAFIFRFLDEVPAQVRAEEFQTWVNGTIQGAVQSMSTSEINPKVIAVKTVAMSFDSAWDTLVAWLLTKGYLSMVTTVVEAQVTVKTITVTDIFTFALVGMLGMRIGNSMIDSMFFVFPRYEERRAQPFVDGATQLVFLAQALVSVAIFSISACARVLGLHTNMAALVAAVFGINFTINGCLFWFGKVNRVLSFAAWIVSAGVLFYAGREVWKRFRVLKATEVRLTC